MDPAAAICISDTYKGPGFTLLGLCTCPFSNSPLLRGWGIIYGLGLGVRGPFWGTLVPWLLPLNIPGLEKLGYEGIAVDVPWVSWGKVEGNAVFKGDVTRLAAEVRTLFLWSPVEAFAFSQGSIFVYMIPPQNVLPTRVTPAWVHPGSFTGARISPRYEILQRYHVNAKRPPVSVWNRSAGRLERVAHAQCLRFWITRLFYQHEVYLQISRY